ncbi:UDP-N-acetylmuramate dehydrogenase [Sulfurimonas sp.]|uniref:UDP-N-acetylmuramate dehydrogenase n=1 Tax=Sulfurimonas sp. TaxID=2022749 RepID=UPI0025E9A07A|nr:UDP-N-acetylmuramate dehydrogenase [Sulfurimonas sp.]MDD5157637.1 UDP-N-acetylmuramate dehydrogenase [Sulfurimonas sp.]
MSKKSIDFSKFSSFKIGGIFEVSLLNACEELPQNYYLIGSCNNILVGKKPPPLVKLSKVYDYIKIKNSTLIIGGATPSGKIASFCKKNNIANFEFLSHLPGTLGGIVYMNAGLKEYEIFNYLIAIETCKGTIEKKDIDFGYRYAKIDSPILEASFEIDYGFDSLKVEMFKKMRANQPSTPSAGSCFKNPAGNYAGRLIEEVGLKGFRVGGMEFSTEHANFLVNAGNGVFEDAVFLIQEAQKRVYEKFKIWLECEIVILDINYMGEQSPFMTPPQRES